MPNNARAELIAAKVVLAKRRAATADDAEKAVIDQGLSELNDAIEQLDLDDLLHAAGLVARAADALERVVASARMGPFDNFLADIQGAIGALQHELGAMQAEERLPPAPDDPTPAAAAASPPAPPAVPAMAAAAAAPPGNIIPSPINSKRFEDLREEYAGFFDRCRLRPEFAGNVEFYVSRLAKHKPVYQQLGTSLGIPWVFIGVVHGMECGFDFQTHLHNGDPLSARTVQVPAGRPIAGEPPFGWADSARDALEMKKLHLVADWNLPRMLYLLEAYNGFGYRPRGVPTPYLWSFSTLYRSGKYVADGVFDPGAISKQCGAAVMLRTLQERGLIG